MATAVDQKTVKALQYILSQALVKAADSDEVPEAIPVTVVGGTGFVNEAPDRDNPCIELSTLLNKDIYISKEYHQKHLRIERSMLRAAREQVELLQELSHNTSHDVMRKHFDYLAKKINGETNQFPTSFRDMFGLGERNGKGGNGKGGNGKGGNRRTDGRTKTNDPKNRERDTKDAKPKGKMGGVGKLIASAAGLLGIGALASKGGDVTDAVVKTPKTTPDTVGKKTYSPAITRPTLDDDLGVPLARPMSRSERAQNQPRDERGRFVKRKATDVYAEDSYQVEEAKPLKRKDRRALARQKRRESYIPANTVGKLDDDLGVPDRKPESKTKSSILSKGKDLATKGTASLKDIATKGTDSLKNLSTTTKLGGALAVVTAVPTLVAAKNAISSAETNTEKGNIAGGAAGSLAGGVGGAAIGGKIGTFAGGAIGGLFGVGVGAVPGAVIGGTIGTVIGGILGSTFGEDVGAAMGEKVGENLDIKETFAEALEAQEKPQTNATYIPANIQASSQSEDTFIEANNTPAVLPKAKEEAPVNDTEKQWQAILRERDQIAAMNHGRASIPSNVSMPTNVAQVEAQPKPEQKTSAVLGHALYHPAEQKPQVVKAAYTPRENAELNVSVDGAAVPLKDFSSSRAVSIPQPAPAQETPAIGTKEGTAPRGLSALDQKSAKEESFLKSLSTRESNNNYKATNGQYHGAYQLGNMAFKDTGYKDKAGNWTGKDGINSLSDYMNNSGVQDKAAQELMNKNWGYLNAKPVKTENGKEIFAKDLVGTSIGGVTITESGLLAAAHLGGAGSARQMLRSDGKNMPVDGNDVPLINYMQSMGGKDVEKYTGKPSYITANLGAFTPSEETKYVRAGTGKELEYDNVAPKSTRQLTYSQAQYVADSGRPQAVQTAAVNIQNSGRPQAVQTAAVNIQNPAQVSHPNPAIEEKRSTSIQPIPAIAEKRSTSIQVAKSPDIVVPSLQAKETEKLQEHRKPIAIPASLGDVAAYKTAHVDNREEMFGKTYSNTVMRPAANTTTELKKYTAGKTYSNKQEYSNGVGIGVPVKPSLYSQDVINLGDEGAKSHDVRKAYVADYQKPQKIERYQAPENASAADIAQLGTSLRETISTKTESTKSGPKHNNRELTVPLNFSNVPNYIDNDLGLALINSGVL